jgi:hypothetical protein
MTKEIVTRQIIEAIQLGWNSYSRRFTSMQECIVWWEERLSKLVNTQLEVALKETYIFKQISCKQNTPKRSGWYNTDKGKLFWFVDKMEWSCRDDRISEEYPMVWYEKIEN